MQFLFCSFFECSNNVLFDSSPLFFVFFFIEDPLSSLLQIQSKSRDRIVRLFPRRYFFFSSIKRWMITSAVVTNLKNISGIVLSTIKPLSNTQNIPDSFWSLLCKSWIRWKQVLCSWQYIPLLPSQLSRQREHRYHRLCRFKSHSLNSFLRCRLLDINHLFFKIEI